MSYLATPTARAFHRDNSRVRGLMGPLGSGKSTACSMEIMLRALGQAPSEDGIRYSRWVVIRNSYRELKDTTLKTFFDWVPRGAGVWSESNMTWTLSNSVLYCEVLFRALDRPDDVKKLLSLEVTGCWINEAREIKKSVVDMVLGRIGRYPAKICSWYGLWADTNPPDTDSWWHDGFEKTDELGKKREGWKLFRQPSGLSPNAENIENLVPGYYRNMIPGKSPEWISVYVHGEYGFSLDGKPVWPAFSTRQHVLPEHPDILPSRPLTLGCDFGLTPAAVILQERPGGLWFVLDEIVMMDQGADTFGPALRDHLGKHYRGIPYTAYGDPAGDQRSQANAKLTVFNMLNAAGVKIGPAWTNDTVHRISAVSKLLTTLSVTSQPRLMVSPKCDNLIRAMLGGYHYKRAATSSEERFDEKPDKNSHSHIADALQYACLGLIDTDTAANIRGAKRYSGNAWWK